MLKDHQEGLFYGAERYDLRRSGSAAIALPRFGGWPDRVIHEAHEFHILIRADPLPYLARDGEREELRDIALQPIKFGDQSEPNTVIGACQMVDEERDECFFGFGDFRGFNTSSWRKDAKQVRASEDFRPDIAMLAADGDQIAGSTGTCINPE